MKRVELGFICTRTIFTLYFFCRAFYVAVRNINYEIIFLLDNIFDILSNPLKFLFHYYYYNYNIVICNMV